MRRLYQLPNQDSDWRFINSDVTSSHMMKFVSIISSRAICTRRVICTAKNVREFLSLSPACGLSGVFANVWVIQKLRNTRHVSSSANKGWQDGATPLWPRIIKGFANQIFVRTKILKLFENSYNICFNRIVRKIVYTN